MRIDSCNIGMDSARLYKSSQSTHASQTVVGTSIANGDPAGRLPFAYSNLFGNNGKSNDQTLKDADSKESKEEQGAEDPANTAFNRLSTARRILFPPEEDRSVSDTFHRLRELMVKSILELLFGRRTEDIDGNGVLYGNGVCEEAATIPEYQVVEVREQFSSCYEECEYTSFNATGTVNTADGRSLDININVGMSRRFVSYYEESVSRLSLRTCDPLVINLDDSPTELSDMSFFFDLDCDGEKEKVSSLGKNHGFLALDKNGDGVINDGSELFGTASGDGFKDLAAYDEDGNGWIDEADAIFSALKIWTKDENGNDILCTLKDLDIGALYLGNANTDFSLNDSKTNETKAFVRKTGLFLYESGMAGTMQHVDLVS